MSRSQNNDYISEDVKKAYSLPLFALKFEFNPLWLAVNSTCNSILNWNLSHEFRGQRIFLEIVRAYTIVYRLVSAPCSECPKLMAGSTSQHNVVGNTDEGTQALVVYHLLRDVIRKHLTSTVLRHLENSILLPCPELLERYLSEWKVFITAVNMLKVVFSYLHGPWQKYDIPVDHHMLPTEVVALINWNEYVMTQKIRERLSTQIFELIERATSTQNDDYDLLVREIGQALSMLSDLRHNSYVTIIEEKYLFKISEFYKKEVHVLKARGVVEYIESVLGILKKESDYAIRLLKRSSLQAVVQRVADVLIDEQLSFLSQYMASWIMEDNTIQLTKLYSLLTKSSSGLNELRQVFKKCVCDRGMKDVSTACEEALNSNKDVYRVALEKLISVYRHFVSVKHAFAMDDGIEEAIYSGLSNVTSSCIYLKNHDLLGDELARFAHFELLKNEELFESRAHDIVTLYRLLPAIHAFLASYPKYLSNRLLSDYYHVDHEKLIIEKILQTRTSTGDFARKCGLMLIDVTETSRVLSEKFNMSRTHTGQHTQMDFSALVLTSYSWPDFLRDTSQPIPMSIREDLRDFQEFYSKSCPMRHITFIHRFSRGVLKFNLLLGSALPSLDLFVGVSHLCIAEYFNKKASWDIKELMNLLEANKCPIFLKAINDFVRHGILDIHGISEPLTTSLLQREQHIEVCIGQRPDTSKRRLIIFDLDMDRDLHLETKSSNKFSTDHADVSHTSTDQMQSPAIQAVLIRVFKLSGKLTFQSLLEKVDDDTSLRLKPTPQQVKHALEFLISRGFICREEQEPGSFSYLP